MPRRWIVRIALVCVVALAIGWWRGRSAHRHPDPVGVTDVAPVKATARAREAWVEPVDGACPAGYPVKVTASSGIFHVPGGRFYDRTAPIRCYATAEQAEADGYRRAKA